MCSDLVDAERSAWRGRRVPRDAAPWKWGTFCDRVEAWRSPSLQIRKGLCVKIFGTRGLFQILIREPSDQVSRQVAVASGARRRSRVASAYTEVGQRPQICRDDTIQDPLRPTPFRPSWILRDAAPTFLFAQPRETVDQRV